MLAWPRLPASLCRLVAPLRGCFPGPLFAMFVHLLAGAVVGDGRVRTVTSMLRGAGLSQLVGHGRAHRLFSRAVWDPAVLADGLVRLVAALLVPDGQPVRLVVDDTFFRRRGKKVWAALGRMTAAPRAGRRSATATTEGMYRSDLSERVDEVLQDSFA